MRVFVTGGTGLIGSRLVTKLRERGDHPLVLSRQVGPARQTLGAERRGDRGRPHADRATGWPASRSATPSSTSPARTSSPAAGTRRSSSCSSIAASRARRTSPQALLRKPTRADGQPKALVNASAIGIYGPHGDEELTEDTPARQRLPRPAVRRVGDRRPAPSRSAGIRAAQVRVGVVLDKKGGALAKMLPPFKLFAGGPVGSGKQFMAWIHHEDVVGLFLHALDTAGLRRARSTAPRPNPVTNRVFCHGAGQGAAPPRRSSGRRASR